VHLLHGNVLYALTDESHVRHAPARHWFSSLSAGFATCPIKQGTLLRLVMRLGRAGRLALGRWGIGEGVEA
jgi:predicted nucleic acid-binding protein